MARLCIRVKPNDHPTNSALTPLRTRLGDVVCVMEDSHIFSPAERNNGHYRFIQVTDATPAELTYLIDSVFDATGTMTKRRERTLNAVALVGGSWAGRTTATKAEIDSIVIART